MWLVAVSGERLINMWRVAVLGDWLSDEGHLTGCCIQWLTYWCVTCDWLLFLVTDTVAYDTWLVSVSDDWCSGAWHVTGCCFRSLMWWRMTCDWSLFQVTDAVVEAHLATTINTYKAIDEANRRISAQKSAESESSSLVWNLNLKHAQQECRLTFYCTGQPGL